MGRPMKLVSKTWKIDVGCGSMNFILSYHEKTHKACECFIKSSKLKECHVNHEAIAGLLNLAMEHDLLDKAIVKLMNIGCTLCQQTKIGLPRNEKYNYPDSCPDAIAKILKDWSENNDANE